MSDNKQSILQYLLPPMKDFALLITFFACFLHWNNAETKVENKIASLYDLDDLHSEEYEPNVGARIKVNLKSVTLPPAFKSMCVTREGKILPCVFSVGFQFFLVSKLDLHPWVVHLETIIGSFIQKFPYKFRFPKRVAMHPNPLRLDLNLAKKKNQRRFHIVIKMHIYRLSFRKKKKLVRELKFQDWFILGDRKKFILGKKSKTRAEIFVTYTKIDCKDIEPGDLCSGSFICDSKGKRICANNYYGQHCKRYCAQNINYKCDKDGERICKQFYYGYDCAVKCIPSKRKICDASGKPDCKKGYKLVDNRCVSKCQLHRRCLNGGECVKEGCKCLDGWGGDHCEKLNCNGFDCRNGGICTLSGNARKCLCKPPYIGSHCEEINGCMYKGMGWCLNFAECKIVNKKSFKCYCLSGYYGRRCEHRVTFGRQNDENDEFSFFAFDKKGVILMGMLLICIVYTTVLIWICGPKVCAATNSFTERRRMLKDLRNE